MSACSSSSSYSSTAPPPPTFEDLGKNVVVRWTTLVGGLSPSSRTIATPSGGGGSDGGGSGDNDISFAWCEDTGAASAASTAPDDGIEVVEVEKGKEVDVGGDVEEEVAATADEEDEEKRGMEVYKGLLRSGGGGKEMYSAKDLDVLALYFAVVKVGGCWRRLCWVYDLGG